MTKFDSYFLPNSSSSFTGLSSFSKQIKSEDKTVKPNKLKEWMMEQEPYTLHRPLRKKFRRQKCMVSGIDDIWQADLVDVSKISRENKGIKFLLTIIDVFSKFAWVEPLQNKTSESIVKALKKIIKDRKPNKIQTDKGTEFLNKPVEKLLNDLNINLYTSNSELKASVVERFNRTLKEKMWRYFTFKNSHKFFDILKDLVHSYNNTYHRTIKTKPSLVSLKNEDKIYKIIYGFEKKDGDDSVVNPKFSINDKVRISKNKGIFEKGYTPNWSREIFIIDKVLLKVPPVYEIKDLNNEIIEGTFYEEELQKINKNNEVYSIDKIIRKRTRNKELEYFVSWLGYPKSFNSWINAKDLISK